MWVALDMQVRIVLQQCPRLSKSTKQQVKKLLKKGRKPIICYECNELGHVRADCPKLKPSASESSEDEGSADEADLVCRQIRAATDA